MTYTEMYVFNLGEYVNGRISKEKWQELCTYILGDLIDYDNNILDRLGEVDNG